jgi:hypothetical protein
MLRYWSGLVVSAERRSSAALRTLDDGRQNAHQLIRLVGQLFQPISRSAVRRLGDRRCGGQFLTCFSYFDLPPHGVAMSHYPHETGKVKD